jgi:hypothetical protein
VFLLLLLEAVYGGHLVLVLCYLLPYVSCTASLQCSSILIIILEAVYSGHLVLDICYRTFWSPVQQACNVPRTPP